MDEEVSQGRGEIETLCNGMVCASAVKKISQSSEVYLF